MKPFKVTDTQLNVLTPELREAVERDVRVAKMERALFGRSATDTLRVFLAGWALRVQRAEAECKEAKEDAALAHGDNEALNKILDGYREQRDFAEAELIRTTGERDAALTDTARLDKAERVLRAGGNIHRSDTRADAWVCFSDSLKGEHHLGPTLRAALDGHNGDCDGVELDAILSDLGVRR